MDAVPVRVVIGEDQALLREGLARLYYGHGAVLLLDGPREKWIAVGPD